MLNVSMNLIIQKDRKTTRKEQIRVIQMAIIAIKEKVAMQVTLLQRGVIIRIIRIRWVIRMVAVVVLLIVGKTRRRREIKNNFISY